MQTMEKFSNAISLATIAVLFYIAVALTVHIVVDGISRRPHNPREHFHPHHTRFWSTKRDQNGVDYSTYPWNLEPSEELDAVWDDLLYALNTRISEDEMSVLHENRTNRVKVDGGDYAGVLGVRDPAMSSEAKARLTWDCADHCIDSIRQALMCHANTALFTAEWMNDSHVPINKELRSSAVTTCVKWDSLNHRARKKALVPGNYKYLPGPYEANRLEDDMPGRSD
ncbi:hypothetical protein VTK56DRAFT_8956 [Thermocarpiscus australiensis]